MAISSRAKPRRDASYSPRRGGEEEDAASPSAQEMDNWGILICETRMNDGNLGEGSWAVSPAKAFGWKGRTDAP